MKRGKLGFGKLGKEEKPKKKKKGSKWKEVSREWEKRGIRMVTSAHRKWIQKRTAKPAEGGTGRTGQRVGIGKERYTGNYR